MDKCDCYYEQEKMMFTYDRLTGKCDGIYTKPVGVCWGTKEREECNCGGDKSKCDFYKEKKDKTKPQINYEELIDKFFKQQQTSFNLALKVEEIMQQRDELQKQLNKAVKDISSVAYHERKNPCLVCEYKEVTGAEMQKYCENCNQYHGNFKWRRTEG